MIKIAFFDIDGTMVPIGGNDMTPGLKAALAALKAKGVKIFVSSGRHKCVMANLHDYPFDGYICMNGTLIFVNGEVIHRHPILHEDAVAVSRALMEHNIPCLTYFEDGLRLNAIDDYARKIMDLLYIAYPTELYDLEPLALESPIYEFSPLVPAERAEVLRPCLTQTIFSMGNGLYADISPDDISKADGIAIVLKHFGFSPEEAIAFGDTDNDLEMLDYVGISVAMGNATAEVKSKADYITSSVNEDGVVAGLKHFGLI